MGKFVIKNQRNDQFYFILKAGNGQTILTSEAYTAKQSCLNGINSVRENCNIDNRYELKDSINNKFYFILKAGNGQPIGTSEIYESPQSRNSGIESVKNNGNTQIIEDLS